MKLHISKKLKESCSCYYCQELVSVCVLQTPFRGATRPKWKSPSTFVAQELSSLTTPPFASTSSSVAKNEPWMKKRRSRTDPTAGMKETLTLTYILPLNNARAVYWSLAH